jgi:hypothetical protein
MPRSCVITGTFINQRQRPVKGLVRFTPSRLWVVRDGITWACLAPRVWLANDGGFVTMVTATDNDSVPFTYHIETPAGEFEAYVPWQETGYSLPDLLHRHGVRIAT